MVPNIIVGWEDIEDRSEDRKSKSGTIGRGGCDGRRQILTDFGQKFVNIWRLTNQMDQEVVGRYEFCTDCSCQYLRRAERSFQYILPFSGAVLSAVLPVTSFFKASSF